MVVSSAVSLAVLAAAASQALQPFDPSSALLLNPLNNAARLAAVIEGIGAEDASSGKLELLASRGSAISPSDGRYLSLLGLIKAKEGNPDQAQTYFSAALTVTPTEVQALFGRLAHHLTNREIPKALPYAAVIARRWPEHWSKIEPYLPNMLATPEDVAAVSKTLGNDQVSRSRIVNSLNKMPTTLGYAVALLEQWKADQVPLGELRPLSISISNALFAAKDYTRAYFLFRSMLDDEQKRVAGYIHNSGFTQAPTNSVFDWRIKAQQGASLAIRSEGLEIRFRDSPLQFSGLQQIFRLPPGDFVLLADYTTKDVVAPKPLKFIVTCVGSTAPIATLELKIGSASKAKDTALFRVPETACPAQSLALVNDFSARSWSNRYRGSIVLHSVTVERAGLGGS